MIIIDIKGSAEKSLKKIDNKWEKNIRKRIAAIAMLESTTEIDHNGKLKGEVDRFKIRIGNYRLVYKIEAKNHVLITTIAHRKDIYNKLFGIVV